MSWMLDKVHLFGHHVLSGGIFIFCWKKKKIETRENQKNVMGKENRKTENIEQYYERERERERGGGGGGTDR